MATWWSSGSTSRRGLIGFVPSVGDLHAIGAFCVPSDTRSILVAHVAQAVAALRGVPEDSGVVDGHDTVLVGHSYGGSIISGVADAQPDRVRALVYLDALIPEHGDSSWSMTNDEEHAWYISGSARTGAFVDPLPFFDARTRPLMQASNLTGAWRSVPVKIYVEATGWPGESPLAAMTAKARADDEFAVHSWDTPHNVMRDGPDRVFALIADL